MKHYPVVSKFKNHCHDVLRTAMKTSSLCPSWAHFFVCLLQLSEDGEADYDTIIGMLPEVLADRGGKMMNKCRHVSEYQ
jgi:hypothetical protein